ncbi:MAG: hypothetical protein IT369_10245 [Candidatus Latescibacteria bacterium]|nr:hypothetical protein [Candidatus Latescibacterota bacterium]
MSELPRLDGARGRAIAPLVGIGGKSGDTVIGLSALRRNRPLALVFASPGLAEGTLAELAGWRREGALLFVVEEWEVVAGRVGRPDALVLGIRPGPLAEGIQRRLQSLGAGE